MQINANNWLTRALTLTALVGFAPIGMAVTPDAFTHTTEADFADGDADGMVVTNLGDLKLSSATDPIEGLPDGLDIIQDIAAFKGAQFVAIGPDAKLLMLKEGKPTVIAEFPGEQVFAIEDAKDGLYVGISGDKARVIFIPGDKLTGADAPIDQSKLALIWELPEEKYIWDLKRNRKDAKANTPKVLYVATGPNGRVYKLTEQDGEKPAVAEKVFETGQPNVLSLALDESEAGLAGLAKHKSVQFYAGTDTDGLIYRVDPLGTPYVVYDAPEAEVSALVVMEDGTLYAGTSAAEQAKPGRLMQPVKVEEGRPAPPQEEVEEEKPEPKEEPEAEAEEQEPAEEQPAEPAPKATAEQYDALRKELRERLQEARESGSLTGDENLAAAPAAKPQRASRAKPAAPPQRKNGNAIYQVSPDGFVSEVFRESAMILAIVPNDEKLIVCTGNQGQVYSVDPALQETTVLTDLESSQITCAIPTDNGLLLGAANPGTLMQMSTDVAETGTYTSQVLDAGQISMYGMFKITAEIPVGAAVTVELRSGNVGDPELAAWSKWSAAAKIEGGADDNPLQPREILVSVPPARYLQYRLTLNSAESVTPVVDQIDIAYVAPNTPPVVEKMLVKAADVKAPGNDPDPKVTIQWKASDGNRDRLVYAIHYKPGKADRWLKLADDLTSPKYDWQTQHVPDGWYTVRITAYDKLDNPSSSAKSGGRISEPLLIDNTPPTLSNLKAQALGGGKIELTADVADELSAITSVAYSVDGSETYQASLPDDLIYDSTKEAWGVTISDLSPGGHVIAIRAIDARGNTAYRQLIVDVE